MRQEAPPFDARRLAGRGRIARAAAGLVLLATLLASPDAGALLAPRPDLEIQGFFEAKTALRTPEFKDAELVMQRNTAQIESRWEFLRSSNLFGLSTGPLEEANLSVIGRGAYDSVYDVRESFRERFSDEERDRLRAEYTLREIYGEFLVPPFTLRLGRQQVVWGETDQFRALDVINPLDFRWHWYYEPWEDIRVTVWMARGIYDIGKLGFLEEVFLEGIWIPGIYEKNKISQDPRRPWGFFGQGLPEEANTAILGGQIFDLETSLRDNQPERRLENSEIAFRLKAVWKRIDFSLNYFWTISDDPGAKVRQDLATIGAPLRPDALGTLRLPIDLFYPRSHVVGVSANYAEEQFTQAVFRLESTYTTGIPVSLGEGVPGALDPDGNLYEKSERTVLMLAFDRPTWLKPLNSIRTFFLTGQFFWRHYLDFNRFFTGIPSVYQARVDGRDIEDRFVSRNTDRITEDEFVATFAATTSYGAAGLWQPTIAAAYDLVATAGFTRLELEHIFSDHLIFRLRQDLFWGKTGEGPWFLGERFGRPGDSRQETYFSVVFQF
ncbi:MAG: hypothetical protein HYY35_09210 [Deltaproteobacteria bacterium]|nr:hypothetical protein [Deltaproteobacteria bacterium]